ncbi:hypothetical protein COU17_00695 [Candidatus Kaiserbacteria bacterium CG10_big_fil_rev_8_21_14_0_10_49_17]|uniref:Ribosome-binding factor A n=1 Tax=Candidatus Kaiserbacteria bacterium CG10_big_fil_rev_8_21_14_0_10_49_17 TaxID=1974609 RepID=A0A2M6WFE1_9BACT|nr:MAG: hypothetical protein COU17_00695 [Candidatus Kaiserbacteria bacterium CG10_big_fil_rev_8_21_14_0_10_49_17]
MSERQLKMSALISELAAEFLGSESNRLSLITVTRADISPDFARATIYISVFPDDKEEEALHFTRRKRAAFRDMLKKRLSVRRIPFVEFELDYGEKNRQRIDEISNDVQ